MCFRFLCLAVLISCIGLGGCASGVSVRTNAYLNQKDLNQTFPTASRFYVLANKSADNPLFDAEIKRKIEQLIKTQGFVVVDSSKADFVVEYQYGIDEGKTITETVPEYRPGEVVYRSGTYKQNGQQGSYSGYETTAGYIAHVPVDRVIYKRFVSLHVKDLRNLAAKPIWIAESVSDGVNNDLREIIDYLLVASFRSFGEDTKRFQRRVINPKDSAVQLLKKL